MTPPAFTRLLPDPGTVDGPELIAALPLEQRAPADRPYVLVNFVTSVDGRVGFDGRSRAFSDAGDRILFHSLRERVDGVLAGTSTLTVEDYGRMVPSEAGRDRRVAAGRAPEPLACVVSMSGHIPTQIPLFAEPEARIAVFAPDAPLDLGGVRAQVVRTPLDPASPHPMHDVLRVLRRQHGVRSLLCEGGPTVFGSLLREGVVDELFLTVVPKLAGGDSGPGLTSGPPLPALADLTLGWLLSAGDALYLRYITS